MYSFVTEDSQNHVCVLRQNIFNGKRELLALL